MASSSSSSSISKCIATAAVAAAATHQHLNHQHLNLKRRSGGIEFGGSIYISPNNNNNHKLIQFHPHYYYYASSSSRRLPLIRMAHSSSSSSADYIPDAKFYKVEAILRPWRVPQVSSALLKIGIRGVTISDVKGFGAQGGLTERQAGSEFSEDNFVAKVKMEIVVSKDQVEVVIEKIIEEARTGEIGDGKIFLTPVSDVIRVRTGERGEMAERMVGGRSDTSSRLV